jgi:hypothetical protein
MKTRREGISLIQVLVGFAIAGILAVMVTNLMRSAFIGNAKVTQDSSWNSYKDTANAFLKNPNSCLQSLQSVPLNGTDTNISIKNPAGADVITLNQIAQGVKVTELTANSGTSTNNVFTFKVVMNGIKVQSQVGSAKNYMGNSSYSATFYVDVLASGGTVQKCLLTESGAWTLVGQQLFALPVDTSGNAFIELNNTNHPMAPQATQVTNANVLNNCTCSFNPGYSSPCVSYNFVNQTFTAQGNKAQLSGQVTLVIRPDQVSGAEICESYNVDLRDMTNNTVVATLNLGAACASSSSVWTTVTSLPLMVDVVYSRTYRLEGYFSFNRCVTAPNSNYQSVGSWSPHIYVLHYLQAT